MRLAHALIVARLALLSFAIAPAQATAESGAVEAQLKTMVLTPVTTVAGLPASAQAGLASLFGQTKLELAEPGAEWQVTDVVVKPGMPARRLVAAGCSNDHCLIHYERGGIAHVWTVVMFKLAAPGASLVKGWAAPGGLGPVLRVQEVVVAGQLAAQTKFW